MKTREKKEGNIWKWRWGGRRGGKYGDLLYLPKPK